MPNESILRQRQQNMTKPIHRTPNSKFRRTIVDVLYCLECYRLNLKEHEIQEKHLCVCYLSGPDFWGLVNPEWNLCSKGRRQSPINIDPQHLLFDPQLNLVRVDKHKVCTLLLYVYLYSATHVDNFAKY